MNVRYRRVKEAAGRRVGAALFLASPRGGTILRVSSSVAAVWNLLARPQDAGEILAVFRAAFPAVAASRLRRVIATVVRDLEVEGMIERIVRRRRAVPSARKTRGRG